MEIANRTFLVTGGGSGLGAATARALVARGARVMIVDVNRDPANQLARELGASAMCAAADITDEAQVAQAIAGVRSRFGALNGAVNCAGIAPAERVLGKTGLHRLDVFTRTVQVNLVGTFNVIRFAAQAMQANDPGPDGERGVIVNTASVAAYDGQIGQAAYSASKAGVAGMTLPIARELAKFGIRVMAIAPGIFATPMMAGFTPELQASLGAQVPFPSRLGRPEEFAALVEHVIENRMLNGEVIRLDGALRMGPK